MTIANTDLQLSAPASNIARALVGKVVRYLNNGPSTVRADGVRTFKIDAVEDVFFAKSSGRRCVTVIARDIDDGGQSKARCLQLAGIASII